MALFSFSIHDQPWTSCIRIKISQVLVQFSDSQRVICIDTGCKNLAWGGEFDARGRPKDGEIDTGIFNNVNPPWVPPPPHPVPWGLILIGALLAWIEFSTCELRCLAWAIVELEWLQSLGVMSPLNARKCLVLLWPLDFDKKMFYDKTQEGKEQCHTVLNSD